MTLLTWPQLGRCAGISRYILLLLLEVDDLKLAVLVVLISSELEVGPSMLNMALVMSGQGSGVAGPAVLLEKERLEMLSQREGRGPHTEREQVGSSSSSSVLILKSILSIGSL